MFSLIYGFVEYMCRQDEFHVLIIGLDKSGKTNVLEKLKTLLSDMAGNSISDITCITFQGCVQRNELCPSLARSGVHFPFF